MKGNIGRFRWIEWNIANPAMTCFPFVCRMRARASTEPNVDIAGGIRFSLITIPDFFCFCQCCYLQLLMPCICTCLHAYLIERDDTFRLKVVKTHLLPMCQYNITSFYGFFGLYDWIYFTFYSKSLALVESLCGLAWEIACVVLNSWEGCLMLIS